MAAAEQADQQRAAFQMAACWDWPVSSDNEAVAARAAACEDDEVRERLGWDLLLCWQADRCAICGRSSGRLVIDHDHATGLVRGLLCPSCNTREGFATRGDVFDRYRSQHPAEILGVKIRYWSPFGGRANPQDLGPLPIDDDHPVYVLGRLLAY